MFEFFKKGKLDDLSYEEAFLIHKKLLNNQLSDIQIGYLWGFLETKKITEEELKGFLDATRNEINYIDSDELKPLDLSINYRGKNKTFCILPASIFIAAGAGAKIAGHGNDKIYSTIGITYHEILNKMGCGYIKTKEKALKALELSGFTFIHQKYYSPRLYNLLKKRKEIRFKTYIDILELFLNPFKTSKILVGALDKVFIHKYMELAYYMGFNDVFVINGLEGGVEPFTNKETKLYSNRILGINIYPKDLNINISSFKIKTLKENAKICLSILRNENHILTQWAVLSSAILLIAYGITEDLKEAIDMSEKSLKLNVANEMFEIYKNISNSEIKATV